MKILTTKQQYEAVDHINTVKSAILSGNKLLMLESILNLAELTYIIGGLKELQKGGQGYADINN